MKDPMAIAAEDQGAAGLVMRFGLLGEGRVASQLGQRDFDVLAEGR